MSRAELQAWGGHDDNGSYSILEGESRYGTTEVVAWSNIDSLSKPARNFDERRLNQSQRVSVMESNKEKTDVSLMSKIVFEHEEVPLTNEMEALTENPNEGGYDQREKDVFSVYFDGIAPGSKKEAAEGAGVSFFKAMNGTMAWIPAGIERFLPYPWLFLFLEWNLRSIGQVFFCNSPITGIIILVGLFVQSASIAVHGILALLTGNIIAIILGFNRGLISSGLFGYNAILCGLAICTFNGGGYEFKTLLATVFVSILSVILFVALAKLLSTYNSPPLTFPFNFATLLFLVAVSVMRNVDMQSVGVPALPDHSSPMDQDLILPKAFFLGSLRGVGQVFLANNLISCTCILVGMAFCSRYLTLAALVGSLVGNGISVLTGAENGMIEQGLYGFNSSLTLTAMALFFVPSLGSFVIGLMAVIFTVVVQHATAVVFMPYGLPVMTIPFCIVTLAIILLQGTTDIIVSVPLASITIPEHHLRRVNMLKEGFQLLSNAIENHNKSRLKLKKKACGTTRMLHNSSMHVIEKYDNEEIEDISDDDEFGRMGLRIFRGIDTRENGFVTSEQFVQYLHSLDFHEQYGLDFAKQAISLLDFNRNETLELKEFVAFVRITANLSAIKNAVCTFFDFVDGDRNGYIDFHELNDALAYLEEPVLNEEECGLLSSLSGGKESFYVADIVSFVILSALKHTIEGIQKIDITNSLHIMNHGNGKSAGSFSA